MYNYTAKLRDNWTPFIREFSSHLSDILYESQLEANCMASLIKVMSAMNDQKPWALSCEYFIVTSFWIDPFFIITGRFSFL